MSLSPEDLIKVELRMGRRGDGYDEVSVDDRLDAVVTAMRASQPYQHLLDPAGLAPAGRWRRGYDRAQVDALLGRLRDEAVHPS
ncbi:DivIVA domain-containing protein [Luteipulveratus sp. YIM 133132]|uniref:DivIVA domain-containing protein n=1 Tax=Luteipulveratus flavus TaxID=3031728 RepID=UPI0023B0EB58|nr:DivIVA domain-containing protein [Luteipulveratus sp. YIM 133132]MDE9367515.1 DivIVA domain-containing protein [Luteipulveratus sp. YIM 133132]